MTRPAKTPDAALLRKRFEEVLLFLCEHPWEEFDPERYRVLISQIEFQFELQCRVAGLPESRGRMGKVVTRACGLSRSAEQREATR